MSEIDGKHGVQSLEIGMRVLQVIVNGHRAMALKDITALARMSSAKAHRYLVSLVRTGMVEQDSLTSRYDLGPLAMTLGLVAADRQDGVGGRAVREQVVADGGVDDVCHAPSLPYPGAYSQTRQPELSLVTATFCGKLPRVLRYISVSTTALSRLPDDDTRTSTSS